MREGGSEAFQCSNNELGADRSVLSGTDPNTYGVFAERWARANGGGFNDNQPDDEEPNSPTPTQTPPSAAQIFQGVDWTGNVGLTSSSGTLSLSDVQVWPAAGGGGGSFGGQGGRAADGEDPVIRDAPATGGVYVGQGLP